MKEYTLDGTNIKFRSKTKENAIKRAKKLMSHHEIRKASMRRDGELIGIVMFDSKLNRFIFTN